MYTQELYHPSCGLNRKAQKLLIHYFLPFLKFMEDLGILFRDTLAGLPSYKIIVSTLEKLTYSIYKIRQNK